jgi:uncharacterized membrane protein
LETGNAAAPGPGFGRHLPAIPEKTAMRFLVAYLATVTVFLLVDLAWLGVVARSFYVRQLAALLRDRPRPVAAILFYGLYGLGIVVFAVLPGTEDGGWSKALVQGALFGFFAYATYGLTNYATLRGWPLSLTLVDLAWGTLLSALAAALGTAATLALI